MKKTPGKIHPRKSLFLRTHVGMATREKLAYDMATLPTGEPIVQSKQTGKWYVLAWTEILTLAEQAGIDKP